MSDKSQPKRLNELITEAGMYVSRLAYANSAGQMFHGNRDLYEVFGWSRNITDKMLYAMFNTCGIADQIVSKRVNTTWQYMPQIKGNDKLSSDLKILDKRINYRSELKKLDLLSGVGQFGVTVLCVRGQDYAQPLTKFKQGDLELVTYPSCEVGVENEMNKGVIYGIKSYSINGQTVHPTRVIHVSEYARDDFYGYSKLYKCYNYIHDMLKVTAGTAELYYMTASMLLSASTKDGWEAELTDDDAKALEDNLLKLIHKAKGTIVAEGIDVENISPEIQPPLESYNVLKSQISMSSGYPERVLFGSERGDLASTQDSNSYYEQIRTRQDNYVAPKIVQKFIDRLQSAGAVAIGDYEVEWRDLTPMTEKSKSETYYKYCQAIKELAIAKMDGVDVPDKTYQAVFDAIQGVKDSDY